MSKLVRLYYTDTLPAHYIAEDEDGELWMIACAPLGPEPWGKRRPYRGHRAALRPVRPQAELVAMYGGRGKDAAEEAYC